MKFSIFSEMTEDLDFLISRGIQFQSRGGGAATILELTLGTTS